MTRVSQKPGGGDARAQVPLVRTVGEDYIGDRIATDSWTCSGGDVLDWGVGDDFSTARLSATASDDVASGKGTSHRNSGP